MSQPAPIAVICSTVAAHYGITLEELTDRRGPRAARPDGLPAAWPRQVAIYFAHELLGLGYSRLGREFSRHHATCIYAVKQVQRICSAYPMEERSVARLGRSLLSNLHHS